jgi:hypothetical protein
VRSLASWNASRSPVATTAAAAACLLRGDGRGEEVVRLVPGAFRSDEPEGRDELGQQVELLQDRVVELATALVARKELAAVGRNPDRVPSDQDRTRLLGLPEPDEHVREPDHCVQADRLRQRVVRAVRERVAVDRE